MTIRDMWAFDNGPVGVDVSGGITYTTGSGSAVGNTLGTPGCVYRTGNGTGSTTSVTSDGFLTQNQGTSANGFVNPITVMMSEVQNWSTATQFWLGFRTKTSKAFSGSSPVVWTASAINQAGAIFLLNETQLAGVVNVEQYVEVFIDAVAQTYQVYVDGVLKNSGAFSGANVITSSSLLWWGGTSVGTANSGLNRGFRDFYFLDVSADGIDAGRLGALRSSLAPIASVSGSEYTLNSAATLQAGVTTALQNPPTATPSVTSPADKQALAVQLGTVSGTKVFAVQGQASLGLGSANTTVAASLVQTGQTPAALGTFPALAASMQYNRRFGIARQAPDGGAWTAAKLAATQYLLTPQ